MNNENQRMASHRSNGGVDVLTKKNVTWLVVILVVGLALRTAYLLSVTSNPHFTWIDPDSYMEDARELAGNGNGWRWTFEAVEHSVEGRHYALPPLYPVFLSLFALFPFFPLTAQFGQVVLATLAIVFVFELGRQIHFSRAGLIAAGVYALWLPNIIAVWSTMQEALYVPLVLLAFVLLTRGVNKETGWLLFGLSGLVFGLSALTRSMPMYFMIPVSVLHWATARNRKHALLQVGALVVGFALVTIPYSVALSLHLGEATFIENHGGLRIVAQYGGASGHRPGGLVDTAFILGEAFVDSPRAVLGEWTESARSIFHVNGGRLLQIYLAAKTYVGAILWKTAAHVGADLLFIGSLVLAPFGLIVAKRWRIASLFALWVLLNISLTALSGFGGSRLRVPIEPHLIVLAGVVLAGQFPRRSYGWWALSASIALVSTLTVLPQVPTSLRARGDYGVRWSRPTRPKRTTMTGRAGFNILPANETISFVVRVPEPTPPQTTTRLRITIDSGLADDVLLQRKRRRFIYAWPQRQTAFVEITAKDPDNDEPTALILRLGRPPR
jgi:4-amino-4-deoxy-L-arabinose transferase-like glycosyltransferase